MNKYNSEIGAIFVGVVFGIHIGLFVDISERSITERVVILCMTILFGGLYLINAIRAYSTGKITITKT